MVLLLTVVMQNTVLPDMASSVSHMDPLGGIMDMSRECHWLPALRPTRAEHCEKVGTSVVDTRQ